MAGFARELAEAAARVQLVPRLVSDRPEEWRLGRLTAVIDRRRGTAQLRYARVSVGRCAAEPPQVMAAWQRAIGRLERGSLAPEELWPLLAAAYDARRSAQPPAVAAAGRVPLVEVGAEVAARLGRRYPRSQFAWDLARLRTERRLVHSDGRRLDLGVATGNAAGRRRQVVWIEDESGRGQYYLHLRMVRT